MRYLVKTGLIWNAGWSFCWKRLDFAMCMFSSTILYLGFKRSFTVPIVLA